MVFGGSLTICPVTARLGKQHVEFVAEEYP